MVEEERWRSCCVDKEKLARLAHGKISTSCYVVLDECLYRDEHPVRDGDNLTVVLVLSDSGVQGSAEQCF